jgi:hypothetical protein
MKKHTIILLLIIGLGIFLRLFGIWNFSFMHDELSVIGRLNFDTFSDLIEKGVKDDGHPAGIQVFLWLWTKFFGVSEISLRVPFVIMGIFCIPLIYILTKKWFNATAGLFTSGIVAVCQYTIFYSLIARPYIAGLFFTLLLLIVWTRMVIEKDYRRINIILFGFFAAACAYIHQFSMLNAFLISITGLFFVKRKTYFKYLSACLIAIILYAPHIPIVLYQINLGPVALDSPTPVFILFYIKYLFHFSWITALGTVIGLLISSNISKKLWNMNKVKIGIAFALFIAPIIIGYFYSIIVTPMLQYSALFFSFPFLLILAASFIDSKLNFRKLLSLVLILVLFTYSLAISRKHYKLLSMQWHEKSVLKGMEWIKKHGQDNVDCILIMTSNSVNYYEKKYGSLLNNRIYKYENLDDFSFAQKVESFQGNYLVVAGLTDIQIEIIKYFYPVLKEYIPCSTSEIYVFAKMGTEIEGMQKINSVEYTWNEPIPAEYEFITVKECNLSDLYPSRFTKILLTFDYQSADSIADYALVLQTSYKGNIADWRCVKPSDFSIKNEENYRSFLPFRYELLIKDSKTIPHYRVKIFLWNIGKKDIIHPVKCDISIYKSNPYIYGIVENLR